MAFALIVNKTWRRRLLPLINLYLKSGIQKPLQASGLLTKLGLAQGEALLTLPALTDLAEHYPAQNTKHGTVALFTGCLAEHFDRETQEASIKLLTALGFDVLLPEQQTCCGAIHQHNGLSAQAMIAQNINTFNALNIEAILYSATGCGAMLSEYTDQGFLDKLQDINDFILTHWSDAVNVKPLNSTVAVHEPCSQRNVLKNQQAVYQLLAKVPQLNLISLADNHLCCGAGGSYMLSHPEQAQQLRSLKYVNIKANTADFIVSSNYACAAFLQTSEIKVKHPLVVLAGLI